jgi:hypothetical protein
MYCTSAMKSYTIFAQQGRVNDHSSGRRLQLEHAVAGAPANTALQSDRFAREIVRFLKSSCAARSQQLNARPFGGSPSNLSLF